MARMASIRRSSGCLAVAKTLCAINKQTRISKFQVREMSFDVSQILDDFDRESALLANECEQSFMAFLVWVHGLLL